MPYTHILVAVDLTEECREVIQRAQAQAERQAQAQRRQQLQRHLTITRLGK